MEAACGRGRVVHTCTKARQASRSGISTPCAMFNLAVLRDTVRILPEDFNRDPLATIADALNRKYANKVRAVSASLMPGMRVRAGVGD